MHISDGILGPEVCIGTALLAGGAVAVSLRRVESSLGTRAVPLTGMVSALIFAGQAVNFTLPGTTTSGHLLGGALASILLGPWAGCLALAVVLFVQMAVFYDGGWTVLGANVLNMAVIGTFAGYFVFDAVRRAWGGRAGVVAGAMAAGWCGVLAAAAAFCLEFALSPSSRGFVGPRMFTLMILYHAAIGVGEALITGLVVSTVVSLRPDLVHGGAERTRSGNVARFATAGIVAAFIVAGFVAPFASPYDDGLEVVAAETGFDALARPADGFLLSDYAIPGLPAGYEQVSAALAVLAGTAVVLVMSVAMSWPLVRTSGK